MCIFKRKKHIDAPKIETQGTNTYDADDLSQTAGTDDNGNIRSWLAKSFLIGYFAVLLLCFIYSFCYKFSSLELKDLLLGASGILSAPFGFVIGYYFKNGDDK